MTSVFQDFFSFGSDTKGKGNKSENKHMRLHQTKKLCTAEEASNKAKENFLNARWGWGVEGQVLNAAACMCGECRLRTCPGRCGGGEKWDSM